MPVQRASGQRTLGYCPSAEDPARQRKGKNYTGEGGRGGGGGGGKEEKKGSLQIGPYASIRPQGIGLQT